MVEQTEKLQQEPEKLKQRTAMVEANKPAPNDEANNTDTTKKTVNIVVDPNIVVNTSPKVVVNADPQLSTKVVVAPVSVRVTSQPSLGHLNATLGKLNTNLNVPDTIRYRNSRYNRTFREIVRELAKMKVLTDTSNVSINLNDKELIVNGVKQPEDVHKAIFEKFGKNGAGFGYRNRYSGNYNNNYSRNYNYNSNSNSGSSSYSYSYSSSDSSDNRPGRPRVPAVPRAPRTPRTPRTPRPEGREERQDANDRQARSITDDLLKDGLITNTNNISFKLTTKEFILNGKKQSDAIFEKYKKKYVPADSGGNWTWTHSHSDN